MGKYTSGVYAIVNRINGHAYIGSSITIERRWHQHICELNGDNRNNKYVQNAWKLYGGIDSFLFVILERTKELIKREKWWVNYFRTFTSLYNRNEIEEFKHPGNPYPSLTSPTGQIYPPGINLSAFRRDHNLSSYALYDVINDKTLQYKGWHLTARHGEFEEWRHKKISILLKKIIKQKRKEQRSPIRLTSVEEKQEIKKIYEVGKFSSVVIAEAYKSNTGAIQEAIKCAGGKMRSHFEANRNRGALSEEHKQTLSRVKRLFTDEEEEEIKKVYEIGRFSLSRIARIYGCSQKAIRNAVIRRGRQTRKSFGKKGFKKSKTCFPLLTFPHIISIPIPPLPEPASILTFDKIEEWDDYYRLWEKIKFPQRK